MRIFLTRRLPEAVETRAREIGEAVCNLDDRPWSDDQWEVADAPVIVPTVTDGLTAARIAALLPNVRLLANFGAGVSHIDLGAAKARGIAVTNTPDVLTDATADVAMLLMLGAARRAGEGEAMMRAGAWTGWAPTQMLGTHLHGQTLGIFGMGRIGAALALRALAFGMEIVWTARGERFLPFPARFLSGDEFWRASKFLSLHAPLTDATRGILGARTLALLPAGSIVVNTARGELVDDDALIAALKSGQVAAAGLDVFTGEPGFDRRYALLPNTFLLPHLGSATVETRTAMGMRALANVAAFLAGEPLPDRIA